MARRRDTALPSPAAHAMTLHADVTRFGEPLTAEEELQEAAAAAEPLDPEDERLADYLAGALSPGDAQALEARLASDSAYREWAAPLLNAVEMERAHERVDPAEVEALWERVIASAQMPQEATPPAAGQEPRPRRTGIGSDFWLAGIAVALLASSLYTLITGPICAVLDAARVCGDPSPAGVSRVGDWLMLVMGLVGMLYYLARSVRDKTPSFQDLHSILLCFGFILAAAAPTLLGTDVPETDTVLQLLGYGLVAYSVIAIRINQWHLARQEARQDDLATSIERETAPQRGFPSVAADLHPGVLLRRKLLVGAMTVAALVVAGIAAALLIPQDLVPSRVRQVVATTEAPTTASLGANGWMVLSKGARVHIAPPTQRGMQTVDLDGRAVLDLTSAPSGAEVVVTTPSAVVQAAAGAMLTIDATHPAEIVVRVERGAVRARPRGVEGAPRTMATDRETRIHFGKDIP